MAFKMKRSPIKGVTIPEQIFGTGNPVPDTTATSASQSLIESAGQFVTPVEPLDLDYGGEMDIKIPVDLSAKEGEVDPEKAEKRAEKRAKRKKKIADLKTKISDFLKKKKGPGKGEGEGEGGGEGGEGSEGSGGGDAGDAAAEEERNRQEEERKENERLEKERIEKEKIENERLEKERLEKEKLEAERLEKERVEREMSKMRPIETIKPKVKPIETPESSLGLVTPTPLTPEGEQPPPPLAHEDPKKNPEYKMEGKVVRTGSNKLKVEGDDGKVYEIKSDGPGYIYHQGTDEWYYTNKNGDITHVQMEQVPEGHLILHSQEQQREHNKQKAIDREYRKIKFNPKKRREFLRKNPDFVPPNKR